MPHMIKPITEITHAEHALVIGFVAGDDDRRMAVLLRYFEGQSIRRVAEKVGIPRQTIDDLVKRFAGVYTAWRSSSAPQAPCHSPSAQPTTSSPSRPSG